MLPSSTIPPVPPTATVPSGRLAAAYSVCGGMPGSPGTGGHLGTHARPSAGVSAAQAPPRYLRTVPPAPTAIAPPLVAATAYSALEVSRLLAGSGRQRPPP